LRISGSGAVHRLYFRGASLPKIADVNHYNFMTVPHWQMSLAQRVSTIQLRSRR
jgi:hypothetical protein